MKESVFGTDSNLEFHSLRLPSGKRLGVANLLGLDNNQYIVIEASLWVELVKDVLKKPGQLRKATKDKLIDFLCWFATKGLYAEAYTALRGKYTQADSQALSEWLSARMDGIPVRKKYTTFLAQQGCYKFYHFSNWTNFIYRGLFGMTAKQMKQQWDLVDGDKEIGRNHITDGLNAIAFCEDMVIRI
jgi:hypothetical protein